MKFKIIKTEKSNTLLVEISSAKEMYKFECATYIENNDHFDDSEFTIFKYKYDISCDFEPYTFIGNTVIVSILVYGPDHIIDKDIAKLQAYLQKNTI